METSTKLSPVLADLYWVKPGQTGQTPSKEKSSKGQIPWCSQTGQAATGQEESIIQRKAVGAQLSLKNFWAIVSPAVPVFCAKAGRDTTPLLLDSCLV